MGTSDHDSFIPLYRTELCVLCTFGSVDFSLVFICVQSVSEFLWDRLRASIQFPSMPKRAQSGRPAIGSQRKLSRSQCLTRILRIEF
eukprot:COSAG02_NODE_37365_length_442_cov_46.119534_1_plen_86_part_01